MAKARTIIYRGTKMPEHWPEEIQAAQAEPTITLQGQEYDRVRYGSESWDWGAKEQPCGDCGVIEGEFHVRGCDIEECPRCRRQLITCDCHGDEGEE